MNNPSLITLVAAFIISCSGASCETAGKENLPNIIFVFTDQQASWQWSGVTPEIRTPNLERIAKSGMVFSNCVVNNPICVPMRAILMTGQYSQQNGYFWNSGRNQLDGSVGISPKVPAWPRILRDAGYRMGYVGKLHLYPQKKTGQTFKANNEEIELEEEVPEAFRIGFDHFWRASHNYQDRNNTWYYDENGDPCLIDEYGPWGQMRQAMAFIENNRDRPFCMVLSWHPPHPSYAQGPPAWVDYYHSHPPGRRGNVSDPHAGKNLDTKLVGAYAHISAMDEAMGWLLDQLAELGLEERTIVVFTSDHGDMLASQGWLNKRTPWTESVNVPFLIQWKGTIPSGGITRAPLSTVDLGPTLLGFCGLSPDPAMQGTDYSGFIKGQKGAPVPGTAFIMRIQPVPDSDTQEKKILTEHAEQKRMNWDWRGIKTERFTYVYKKNDRSDPRAEPWLLFDDIKDPLQKKNLIDDPTQSEKQEELGNILSSYLEQVGESGWLNH